jgi:protein-L-isoaspartate O-methyltransferase
LLPVGEYDQELVVVEKHEEGTVSRRDVIPVRFVPMTGESQEH